VLRKYLSTSMKSLFSSLSLSRFSSKQCRLYARQLFRQYVALLHAFGRIGCFCAGCCGGTITHSALSIVYTDYQSRAPLNMPVHPTQLYSSAIFFCVFIILRWIAPRYLKKPGQITLLYLMLASSERFFLDFIRSDRIMVGILSFHQWLALAIIIIALTGYMLLQQKFEKIAS
jgi:phosphatidylglycerol---prolipoprotein diacylglyceryl transferase